MSRKYAAITLDELKGAVAHAWSQTERFAEHVEEPLLPSDPMKFLTKTHFDGGKFLTPTVTKDLNKVQFDTENCEWERAEAYEGMEGITGFRTLPNGMPFLGVGAGGDWEAPLFYIIYWDGKELRGYIPTDGNTWNTDTKTAYGSAQDVIDGTEEEVEAAECKNAKARFGVDDYRDANPDEKAIIADIQARIQPSGTPGSKPKSTADINEKGVREQKAKMEAEHEEWNKQYKQEARSLNGTAVSIMGANGASKPQTFTERLAEVKADTETFLKELDELSKLDLNRCTVGKATAMRDGTLRKLVSNYVLTVNLMDSLAE